MKIGLNATCLNHRPSGAKQRFVGIYGNLVKRMPDSEFVVYEPTDCRVGNWFHGAPNVTVRRTPVPSEGRVGQLLAGSRYWGAALARERFDVFEMFNLPLVCAPSGRTLLTIHDIRRMQVEYGALARAVFKPFLERSLRTADRVITVSESMKKEMLNLFPGVPISVIYNGLDTQEFDRIQESDLDAARRKFALPEAFILAVGHLEQRKNYIRLLDALARLRDRGSPYSLIIVGNDSGLRRAIEERINTRRLQGQVMILSGLSDAEVRCTYRLCSLFVFPSFYEGFGIPILEAMAAGRPMVLSDIPVFREITENRGVYFPHDDVDAIASTIAHMLAAESERARLVEYGRQRVQAFTFQNLAAQVEALYKALP